MPDRTASIFGEFFERHRRHLVRYVSRLVSSSDVAEDLTQEAFARVYVVRDREMQSPRSFLYRTAHNLAMDHIRHQRVAAAEPLDAMPNDAIGDETPSAETRLAARQALELIRAAIEELPPKCRMVFILLRFEGCSNKEVALRMALSETMVRKYAVRAIEHCRTRLEEAGIGRDQPAKGAKYARSSVNHLYDTSDA